MSTSMLRRQLKNIVQNFSEAEIKVREATSNDPWGPSSSLMAEISDLTYNVVACSEIMTMVWKRLNDSGKNWRHVYKAMTLLDYLLKTGSDRVAQQCNENIYVLQTLREFQFIDRDGKDQGVNVREKAKQLVTLLKDEEKLKEERAQALKTKEKMAQTTSASSTSPAPALSLANRPGGLQLGGVASLIKAPESQAAGDETKSKEEADQAPQTEGGSSNLWGAPAAPADSSAPPAGSDPWGGPTSSPPANSDPWGRSASSPPGESDPWGDGGTAANASSDPWGDSSKASNDPWGSSAAVSPPGGDPWGAGTAAAGDPWGTGGGAPPADSMTSDPWGGPANGAGDQKLSDVTAGGGGEEGGGRGGAPASLDLSSISAALPAKKTPESFLGANASLVDLDSLISSKPKPKQSGPSMASMVTKPSPFTQSQGSSPAPAMAVTSVSAIFGLGASPAAPLTSSPFGSTPLSSVSPLASYFGPGHLHTVAQASPSTSGKFRTAPEKGA
ncbi:epsin-1-like [Anguilla anguilla]|uniref:epsin-1-like n=1 Tax=Anguilla anguilla TaxID=7936 RepID=UPI0015B0496C|nr:epsin-1-like [Anguilla anguilla]XP_035286926.1 epsin-1-like [Anguilla anguilla]